MKAEGLLEELKSRLDIVDIISDYVELRRLGKNYKGLCPFHSEKTPSFIVSPDKQIFHCFGCGAGGNILSFVMRYENLSLSETVRLLAKKAGIDPGEYKFERKDEGLKDKLIDIHKEAKKAFSENLKRSREALAYLKNRGINEETINKFSIGYALKNWHSLCIHLRNKGVPDSLMLQSGLAASGEKGVYDVFRDRIIFPISDIQGNVIAFGGRVMDDSMPKYLNSPDTALFKKSATLYGLDHAKDGIRKNGYAIIVEGYFDVAVCHQFGLNNAAAPLGTALTAGHLQKLRRFTKKAVMVFDGDAAGKAAAKRSLPLLLEQGVAAKILLLPENDDPDSFLRRDGAKSFDALLSKAHPVIGFLLHDSGKEKTEAIHEALETIAYAKDTIMKEEFLRELSEKTGVRETVIREELSRVSKKLATKAEVKEDLRSASNKADANIYGEEFLLLSAVLAFPDRYNDILSLVSLEEFRSSMVGELLKKMGKAAGSVDLMLPSLTDEEKKLATRLAVNPGFDIENVDKNIDDCVRKIIMRRHDEQIRQAESAGDLKLLSSLLLKRQRLLKEGRLPETADRVGCR